MTLVEVLFYLILFFIIGDFILERYLSFLNFQYSKNELPDILKNIYDADQYSKQQDYFRTNIRFGTISSTFNFIVILIFFCLGGFGWLDTVLRRITEHPILLPLLYFGVLFVAETLISIPFQWYDTFVIEQKFGFNKVTPKLFVLDQLKEFALSVIIGGVLLGGIVWIYNLTPAYFWLIAWLVVTLFSVFMSMFYSQIIVPLFNKQKPLEEGELRNEIEKFAAKAGFKLDNIYIIDSSKRSTKANAYFTGLGNKKRVVLYDTLLDKLTTEEIVAVLAHEIGHYKKKHTLYQLLISLPESLLLFFLLGLILKSNVFAQVLGGTTASFHLNVIAFGLLYTPVSLLLSICTNILSRKFEYQADAFAAAYGWANQLQNGLKKLAATSLSNLMPHPLYAFFHYSHPTLYQRLTKLSGAQ
ncbi:MAG TPA: M48 family metallopeptidase [Paludibacteraceae bacterium]|jgi:STE24 endopeptidase|nr:M48 family metallopeptidase [Paludibacteraceae bacterium]